MKRPDSKNDPSEPLQARALNSLEAVPERLRRKPTPKSSGVRQFKGGAQSSQSQKPRKQYTAEKPSGNRAKGARQMTVSRIRNISEHYVASRECSRAMLRSVLERRLDRRLRTLDPDASAREQAEADPLIEAEIDRLVKAGLIDDARFAEMKARSSLRRGLGTRRIEQDLARKGIDPDTAREALGEARRECTGTLGRDIDDEEVARSAEWEAAETFARKKRIGPYRSESLPDDFKERSKMWSREAGKMARAGFDVDLIRQILDREPEED